MEKKLNAYRLNELLLNLQEISDLKFSLHDMKANELYSANKRSTFCDLICDTQAGYAHCHDCDLNAVNSMKDRTSPMTYRCHAGLLETAIPITDEGSLEAVILFGQILDDSPRETQWEDTKGKVTWYSDQDKLKTAFFHLPQFTHRKIRAVYEIINACVSEVRLEKMVEISSLTDAQRLQSYLNDHYQEKLTLDDIAKAISVSKSKLFKLADEIEPDQTVGQLLTKRRVRAAKRMLEQTNLPIREIAEECGIPDFNYFTKVFKAQSGQTPSFYRADYLEHRKY